MTDAPFPAGRAAVVRAGAAGGATRPSTGYTFAARSGRRRRRRPRSRAGSRPEPPPAVPGAAPARWTPCCCAHSTAAPSTAPTFLTRLFDRQPVARVLRFLDGATSPAEDLAVMAAAPRGPMLRTVLRR